MKRLTLILVVLLLFVSACSSPAPEPMEPTETSPPTVLDRYKELLRQIDTPVMILELPGIYDKQAMVFYYHLDNDDPESDASLKLLNDVFEVAQILIDDTEAHEEYSLVAIQTWRDENFNELKAFFCADLIKRQPIIYGTAKELSKVVSLDALAILSPYRFLDLYLEQGPAAFQVTP